MSILSSSGIQGVPGPSSREVGRIQDSTEEMTWHIGCRANSNIDAFQLWIENEIAEKKKIVTR